MISPWDLSWSANEIIKCKRELVVNWEIYGGVHFWQNKASARKQTIRGDWSVTSTLLKVK